jgi:hypothetical protein
MRSTDFCWRKMNRKKGLNTFIDALLLHTTEHPYGASALERLRLYQSQSWYTPASKAVPHFSCNSLCSDRESTRTIKHFHYQCEIKHDHYSNPSKTGFPGKRRSAQWRSIIALIRREHAFFVHHSIITQDLLHCRCWKVVGSAEFIKPYNAVKGILLFHKHESWKHHHVEPFRERRDTLHIDVAESRLEMLTGNNS